MEYTAPPDGVRKPSKGHGRGGGFICPADDSHLTLTNRTQEGPYAGTYTYTCAEGHVWTRTTANDGLTDWQLVPATASRLL